MKSILTEWSKWLVFSWVQYLYKRKRRPTCIPF